MTTTSNSGINGVSVYRLARLTGFNSTFLSRMLKGEVGITLGKALLIAIAAEVPLDELAEKAHERDKRMLKQIALVKSRRKQWLESERRKAGAIARLSEKTSAR